MCKLLAVILLGAATLAQADESSPNYLGASAHFYRPDRARTFANGTGGSLFVGVPINAFLGRASLEFAGFGSVVSARTPNPAFTLYGVEADLRIMLADEERYSTFVIAGLGASRSDKFKGDNPGFLTGGLGLLLPFARDGLAFRAEARTYVMHSNLYPNQDMLFEYRAGLGFEYTFPERTSFAPAPSAAEEAAPLPAQRRVARDSDGDGVPDSADECPFTPAGTTVDRKGCPIGPVDSDGDGIVDEMDRCPGTPLNAAIDNNGCALMLDSDGDGIVDARDRCPDTPPGAEVDFQGCQLAQTDSDNDGVPDASDRCPATPPGIAVNAQGCPQSPDVDGDAVPNENDRCPGTPPGMRVDLNGCVVQQTMTFRNINFNFDSSDLTDPSKALLNRVAEGLKNQTNLRIEIGGHTDSLGSQSYNLTLSQKRARTVRDYLISRGVAANRLQAEGYGEFNPVAENETEEGRAKNRRVEFNIRQ